MTARVIPFRHPPRPQPVVPMQIWRYFACANVAAAYELTGADVMLPPGSHVLALGTLDVEISTLMARSHWLARAFRSQRFIPGELSSG